MLYKWKLSILLLFALFSSSAFSAVYENLFHELDKHDISATDKNHQKKFIKLENDIFDAIEKRKTYADMFV